MKGFIKVNMGDDSGALINVSRIESVLQTQYAVEIYIIDSPRNPWIVDDSYEDIMNKIKQTMEE